MDSEPVLEIQVQVKLAPTQSGCYLWKNKAGEILYIGKASNIRSRLLQYLSPNPDSLKTKMLMQKVASVEWIGTRNAKEALLLEITLVGKHKPPYNVRLKDDKSFPYICISIDEKYPRVFLTRDTKNKKARYYGPYTDVRAARNTLNLIHKIFPVRKVKQKLPLKKMKRPPTN